MTLFFSCKEKAIRSRVGYFCAEFGNSKVLYSKNEYGLFVDSMFVKDGITEKEAILTWVNGDLIDLKANHTEIKLTPLIKSKRVGLFLNKENLRDTIELFSQGTKEFFLNELSYWVDSKKDTLIKGLNYNEKVQIIPEVVSDSRYFFVKNYALRPFNFYSKDSILSGGKISDQVGDFFHVISMPKVLGDDIAFATKVFKDSIRICQKVISNSNRKRLIEIKINKIDYQLYNKIKIKLLNR